jgi:hypothetical protein
MCDPGPRGVPRLLSDLRTELHGRDLGLQQPQGGNILTQEVLVSELAKEVDQRRDRGAPEVGHADLKPAGEVLLPEHGAAGENLALNNAAESLNTARATERWHWCCGFEEQGDGVEHCLTAEVSFSAILLQQCLGSEEGTSINPLVVARNVSRTCEMAARLVDFVTPENAQVWESARRKACSIRRWACAARSEAGSSQKMWRTALDTRTLSCAQALASGEALPEP